MIITKCDRCGKVMDTPTYARGMFPMIFPNANEKQYIPKYMIIRCEPNEGRDTLNLCPECEHDFDAFLDNPPKKRTVGEFINEL
jgi:hypothetical protein